MTYTFVKEETVPASSRASPFFSNLPPSGTRPIDDLVFYFKCWKKFIKSLIFYLNEVVLTKEFTAKLNMQLVKSVLFPGAMNLPKRYLSELAPATPPKELRKTLSGTALPTLSTISSVSPPTPSNPDPSLSNPQSGSQIVSGRPNFFRTKSNQSFLKPKAEKGAVASAEPGMDSRKTHRRNISSASLSLQGSTPTLGPSSTSHGPVPGVLAQSAQQAAQAAQALKLASLTDIHAQTYEDICIPDGMFSAESSLFLNLPNILFNDHFQKAQNEQKTAKEINTKIIPRLKTLQKNLSDKIKEIRTSLKNESFANTNLAKDISKTGQILNSYKLSVERYSNPTKPVLKRSNIGGDDAVNGLDNEYGVLDDPFLLKLQLDYQLKSQLVDENYCFASYLNLQNIARDLSNYVVKDLRMITNKIFKLIDQESCYNELSISALYNQLVKLTADNKPEDEWVHFIANNPSFINSDKSFKDNRSCLNPYKHPRSFGELSIPYSGSIHNKCIRNGILYKKLKILKTYNKYFYILTCNYIHEYKIPETHNEESQKKDKLKIGGIISPHDFPEYSYNLNDYTILQGKDSNKFVLQLLSNKSKKFTFKSDTEQDFDNWWTDLLHILKFESNHLQRFEFVQEKMQMKSQIREKKKNLPDGMALNLSSISNLTNPNSSLNAIFTPRIHTPQPTSGSQTEGNPFESTFTAAGTYLDSGSIGSNSLNSPVQSPGPQVDVLANYTASVDGGALSLEAGASHEDYLVIQQAYLKNQQKLLNEKIKHNDAELGRPKLNRDGSTGSVNSIVHQSNINALLNNFTLKQDSQEVPKVFVSSNH